MNWADATTSQGLSWQEAVIRSQSWPLNSGTLVWHMSILTTKLNKQTNNTGQGVDWYNHWGNHRHVSDGCVSCTKWTLGMKLALGLGVSNSQVHTLSPGSPEIHTSKITGALYSINSSRWHGRWMYHEWTPDQTSHSSEATTAQGYLNGSEWALNETPAPRNHILPFFKK